MGPKIIIPVALGKAVWDYTAMEEIAHDAIRHCPVVAVDTVVMRAQSGVTGKLESTRSTQAHI